MAIFNINSSKTWSQSGLHGMHSFSLYFEIMNQLYIDHVVVNVCLLFRILHLGPFADDTPLGHQIMGQFLVYFQHYNVVSQHDPTGARLGMYSDANTGLYLLKRAVLSTGKMLGNIIPLNQLRPLVDVASHFSKEADSGLINTNSIVFAKDFWLNKYFNKELFHILSL